MWTDKNGTSCSPAPPVALACRLLFFFQGFQHPTLSSVSTTLGEIGRGFAERDIASWSGLHSGSRKRGHCLCQEEAEEGEKRRSFERERERSSEVDSMEDGQDGGDGNAYQSGAHRHGGFELVLFGFVGHCVLDKE